MQLQHIMLSSDLYRGMLLFAFAARHSAVLAQALRQPPPGGWEACGGYFVDPAARQLLQFAALHALSTHLQVRAPGPGARALMRGRGR